MPDRFGNPYRVIFFKDPELRQDIGSVYEGVTDDTGASKDEISSLEIIAGPKVEPDDWAHLVSSVEVARKRIRLVGYSDKGRGGNKFDLGATLIIDNGRLGAFVLPEDADDDLESIWFEVTPATDAQIFALKEKKRLEQEVEKAREEREFQRLQQQAEVLRPKPQLPPAAGGGSTPAGPGLDPNKVYELGAVVSNQWTTFEKALATAKGGGQVAWWLLGGEAADQQQAFKLSAQTSQSVAAKFGTPQQYGLPAWVLTQGDRGVAVVPAQVLKALGVI